MILLNSINNKLTFIQYKNDIINLFYTKYYMNLFILSICQREIAMYMMDKHVYKILLEAVQMLCTAKKLLEPEEEINEKLYKISHKNHPVSIWCRTSRENYIWTLDLVEELHNEWKYRYNHPETKVHKSYIICTYLRNSIPNEICFEKTGLTPFVLAMPTIYKTEDPIISYRNYYMSPEKQKIATWNKKRNIPEWYITQNDSIMSLTEIINNVKSENNINKLTVIKLKAIAKERKIKKYYKMKKQELIDILTQI